MAIKKYVLVVIAFSIMVNVFFMISTLSFSPLKKNSSILYYEYLKIHNPNSTELIAVRYGARNPNLRINTDVVVNASKENTFIYYDKKLKENGWERYKVNENSKDTIHYRKDFLFMYIMIKEHKDNSSLCTVGIYYDDMG